MFHLQTEIDQQIQCLSDFRTLRICCCNAVYVIQYINILCDKNVEFSDVTTDGKHIYCWALQRFEITSVTSQISLDTE